MAFNLPTEEEARAILADQMEAQARRMHDIDYRTPGPLQQAAGAGDVELVRDLLAAGEDPNKLGAEIPNTWKRMQAYNEENGDLAEAKRYEYLATIEEAGGFKYYQKHHTHALAATLAKKFPAHIPEEIFPRIVAFWAHAGFYASAAAVAALPRAAETNPNQEA